MLLLAHYDFWADKGGKKNHFRNPNSDFIFFNSEVKETEAPLDSE